MNAKLLISILAAGVALSSCLHDDEPDVPIRPVIEGWIDSDGYPVVMFTASINPDETGSAIADKMIRWGKVTISDGSKTVIMTGGPSSEYFPPFRYYTFDMKGQPGRTYTIEAEYDNLKASATCTMPAPTEIESIDIEPVAGNDTLRAATLRFIAPEDCPAYYCIAIRDLEQGGPPLPAMMGTAIASTPREMVSMPVMNAKNAVGQKKFVSQLHVGSKLQVGLCRVSKEVYDFWNAYDNMVLFGGSQFVSSSTSLDGNIVGGYGVWSARGTSWRYIEIE